MSTKKPSFPFDKDFIMELQKLEKLASPGSMATVKSAGGTMTVSFHYEEIQAQKSFSIAAPDFEFTLKASEFVALLAAFEKGTVSVDTEEKKNITVVSGRARMARQVENDPISCLFPDFEKYGMQSLPKAIFPIAVFVSYAAAAEGSPKPVAERVSIQLKGGTASMIAMDGYRAARAILNVEYAGEDIEYLLPPRLLSSLAELCKKDDMQEIQIAQSAAKYLIRVGDIDVTAGRPVGESVREAADSGIDYLKNAGKIAAQIATNELERYLQRTKLIRGKVASSALVLKVVPNKSAVYASYKSALGIIEDVFDITLESSPQDTPYRIGYNPKYLHDAVNKVTSPSLTFRTESPVSPTCITEICEVDGSEVEISHLVLPVRIASEPAAAASENPMTTDSATTGPPVEVVEGTGGSEVEQEFA